MTVIKDALDCIACEDRGFCIKLMTVIKGLIATTSGNISGLEIFVKFTSVFEMFFARFGFFVLRATKFGKIDRAVASVSRKR